MTARLTARMLVSGLIRAVESAGGQGMVLAKGDESAGSILLVCTEKGRFDALLERSLAADGRYIWTPTGPGPGDEDAALQIYLDRRRRFDPDIWVVELDIAHAERFAAEMTGMG